MELQAAFNQARIAHPQPVRHEDDGCIQVFSLVDAFAECRGGNPVMRGRLVLQEQRCIIYSEDDVVTDWPRNHWGFTIPNRKG